MSWIITNKKIEPKGLATNTINNQYIYFEENNYEIKSENDLFILIDGYVIPRVEFSTLFAGFINVSLVNKLLNNFTWNFIDYIKGNYTIVVCFKGQIRIYGDRIGIRKFFYSISEKETIVSNNIDNIIKLSKTDISHENIAIHSLMHHFTNGNTILKNVYYNKPSLLIKIIDERVDVSNYWSFGKLLVLRKEKISYENFTTNFNQIIKNYVNALNPKGISLTLTGGMDSRTILSSLLNLGIKPVTFTFGSKGSLDVEISEGIAQKFDLVFNNHDLESSLNEGYNDLVNEIIEKGNSISHLHRAHRLFAIKEESKKNPFVEMLFVGHMGGEGIRGLTYNDYFASKLFENVNEKKADIGESIKEILGQYFHKNIEIENIRMKLLEHDYFQQSNELNKFYFLYQMVAATHHAQDLNIYNRYIKYVIPVYLDIDYLELLYSSPYHFLNKQKRIIGKLDNPALYCNMINTLFPALSEIPFKNSFSPKEYLLSKYYYAAIKKFRDKKKKEEHPNFAYSKWYADYVNAQIEKIPNKSMIFFDIEKAKKRLAEAKHSTKEGYWHKFSNIILMNKIFNQNLND